MEGWLWKKGGGTRKMFGRRNWKKRWVKLLRRKEAEDKAEDNAGGADVVSGSAGASADGAVQLQCFTAEAGTAKFLKKIVNLDQYDSVEMFETAAKHKKQRTKDGDTKDGGDTGDANPMNGEDSPRGARRPLMVAAAFTSGLLQQSVRRTHSELMIPPPRPMRTVGVKAASQQCAKHPRWSESSTCPLRQLKIDYSGSLCCRWRHHICVSHGGSGWAWGWGSRPGGALLRCRGSWRAGLARRGQLRYKPCTAYAQASVFNMRCHGPNEQVGRVPAPSAAGSRGESTQDASLH